MEVVETGSLAVQHQWFLVNDTDTYRVGALVGWEAGDTDGLIMAGAAGAGPDATTKICGVIAAVDTREPTHVSSATAVGNSVAGVVTQADQVARDLGYSSDKAPFVMGDKAVHVKVNLLTPWTKVKVPLFAGDGAFGTAINLLTVTTGSATGLGFTSNTCGYTPVAGESTSYCRTGANAGIFRVSDDTSATVETNDLAFTNDIAVGDTFVRVPCRQGESFLGTDAEGTYFDGQSTSASNYWIFNVLELNLKNAGEEHVIGYFDYQHFD